MSAGKVDVLGLLNEGSRVWEFWTPEAKSLKEAHDAVAELIDADREVDSAMALHEGHPDRDDRVRAAFERREAALAKVVP
jgi:hypothetical protein